MAQRRILAAAVFGAAMPALSAGALALAGAAGAPQPASQPASRPGGMQLGTNFWNIGWHRPGDCFRNWKDVRGGDPWNPQFLKEIAIYRSLRFMDWDVTNGSPRQTWAERNARDNPRQNPVAYEWMIDLCNRNRSDMWVTLPHRTVDRNTGDRPCDYALRLCILVKTGVDVKAADLGPMLDRLSSMTAGDFISAGGTRTCEPLDADLKLYIEYSNETWNGIFKQAHYCCDEGEALGLDRNRWTAGFRFHAWAAVRIFRAADLVFGTGSRRAVRVLATHTANPWIAEQHLGVLGSRQYNPWNVKADAIATAPYFGHQVDGAEADAVAKMRQAIEKSVEQSDRHRKLADAAGLRLIAYEGGQHCTRNAAALNRRPEIHDLYAEYLRQMSRFFTVFSHYCHVGAWGQGGAWGSMEFTGQPIDQAHKYRALVEWATSQPAHPAGGGGRALPMSATPTGG